MLFPTKTNEYRQTLFYRYQFNRAISKYANKSIEARFLDVTEYFNTQGEYQHQWIHLFFLWGFWANDSVSIQTTTAPTLPTPLDKSKKYNIGLRKKLTSTNKISKLNHLTYRFEMKHLSRLNNNIYLTRFVNRPDAVNNLPVWYIREGTYFPGKWGLFSKSKRKTFMAIASCWHHAFYDLFRRLDDIEYGDIQLYPSIGYKRPDETERYFFFFLHSANSLLVKYFYLLAAHMRQWPNDNLYLIVRNQFRFWPKQRKKKRYMKKFKIKTLYKDDRFQRRHHIVRYKPINALYRNYRDINNIDT